MPDVLIPNASRHDVATFNILVDGKDVSLTCQVLSISITKEINRIPLAKIVLRDGEAADRTFALSETNDFAPGKKIKIKAGRDGNNSQFFEGIITKHGIRVRENGNSELHIECRNMAIKMTIGRHSRYFENVKDSEVFDQVISPYRLISDPQSTTLKHKELVQHHISDWDFVLLRAEANGMLINADDGSIKISMPDTTPSPVMQVTYGSSVLEFEAEIETTSQLQSVEASSWDYSNQSLFKADASSTSFTEHGNISGNSIAGATSPQKYFLHHSGHRLEQELQDWSNGMIMRSRLAKIRGRAKFDGFAGVKVGDMVKIAGVGARFNGNAFVTAVIHEIGEGVWNTHIQFGLDPKRYAESHNEDMNDRQTAGLVGAIHGLQIGIAVQLQNDPDGQDRILVKIPVIDNAANGIWMRVASLDAGDQRGAFFRPEIGDEVIVGFINDDPRDAVVLGMLHSSSKSAPVSAKDVNHEKGFTTRSKMHLSFNDDTKTIKMDTPMGNSITLDEQQMKIEIKDQSGNKITMDPVGIKMESLGKIDIMAGTILTLGAGVSLAISGPALSVDAKADVSIKAGGSATLTSNGANTIKGNPVAIN